MLESSRSSIRRSILSTFKKIKEEFRIVGKRGSGMFDVGDGFGVSRDGERHRRRRRRQRRCHGVASSINDGRP